MEGPVFSLTFNCSRNGAEPRSLPGGLESSGRRPRLPASPDRPCRSATLVAVPARSLVTSSRSPLSSPNCTTSSPPCKGLLASRGDSDIGGSRLCRPACHSQRQRVGPGGPAARPSQCGPQDSAAGTPPQPALLGGGFPVCSPKLEHRRVPPWETPSVTHQVSAPKALCAQTRPGPSTRGGCPDWAPSLVSAQGASPCVPAVTRVSCRAGRTFLLGGRRPPSPDQAGSSLRPASRSPSLSRGCRVAAGPAGP